MYFYIIRKSSYSAPDKSTPNPHTQSFVTRLTSYLRLDLPSHIFLAGFASDILYAFFNYPRLTAFFTNFILLELITLIIFVEECIS